MGEIELSIIGSEITLLCDCGKFIIAFSDEDGEIEGKCNFCDLCVEGNLSVKIKEEK